MKRISASAYCAECDCHITITSEIDDLLISAEHVAFHASQVSKRCAFEMKLHLMGRPHPITKMVEAMGVKTNLEISP